MKVKSTSSTSSVSNTSKAGKNSAVGGASFASQLAECMSASDVSSASAVETSSAVSGLDAILAAQSVGDTLKEKNKKMIRRGENILDRLDEVRDSILSGRVSKNRLIELASLVRQQRELGGDPRLVAILDEIELRAEVEIAKLSR